MSISISQNKGLIESMDAFLSELEIIAQSDNEYVSECLVALLRIISSSKPLYKDILILGGKIVTNDIIMESKAENKLKGYKSLYYLCSCDRDIV